MTAISIVLLAMIAAFLGLRLYSVLGKRTGHEQEPITRRAEQPAIPAAARFGDRDEAPVPGDGAAGAPALVYDAAAESGMRALLAADRSFDAGRFLEGAEAAYRIILEAFWSGDRETLRELTDPDSYDAFASAIDEREALGHRLENRLVRINSARIADVELNGKLVRITVSYAADIVAVTRDGEDRVVAGSMSDAVERHERWTYSRMLGSADPNWLLDETESD